MKRTWTSKLPRKNKSRKYKVFSTARFVSNNGGIFEANGLLKTTIPINRTEVGQHSRTSQLSQELRSVSLTLLMSVPQVSICTTFLSGFYLTHFSRPNRHTSPNYRRRWQGGSMVNFSAASSSKTYDTATTRQANFRRWVSTGASSRNFLKFIFALSRAFEICP